MGRFHVRERDLVVEYGDAYILRFGQIHSQSPSASFGGSSTCAKHGYLHDCLRCRDQVQKEPQVLLALDQWMPWTPNVGHVYTVNGVLTADFLDSIVAAALTALGAANGNHSAVGSARRSILIVHG